MVCVGNQGFSWEMYVKHWTKDPILNSMRKNNGSEAKESILECTVNYSSSENSQDYKPDQGNNAFSSISVAPGKWDEDKGQYRARNL